MRTPTDGIQIVLPKGQVFSTHDPVRISCYSGRLWVTELGGGDVFLEGGQAACMRRGPIVIEADREARFTVSRIAAAGEGRTGWAMGPLTIRAA